MNKRKWGLFVTSGVVLLSLCACGRSGLELPQSSVSSHTVQKKSKHLTTQSQPKVSTRSLSRSQESTFVQQFLTAYTTYSSVNAQKAALRPLVTPELRKKLALDVPVSQEANQVTSSGQNLSIWQNGKGQWLGLVTVKINNQTSSVQVFLVNLEVSDQKLLVSQLSSPTQE